MNFYLELKTLPFKPDEKQIIFITGQQDDTVTDLIRHNFIHIRDSFESQGYTFCYIPYVKQALLTGERLHYNAPFAKSSREADYMVNDNFILDYMANPENREKVPPSLLYYIGGETSFRGISISESSFVEDCGLSKVLAEILENIKKHNSGGVRSRIATRSKKKEDDIRFSIESTSLEDSDIPKRDIVYADYTFDNESRTLIREIEERIGKLRQKGIDSYLIESMFRNRERKLSRMHITKEFRIFLGDYMGMEIKMDPLPKALYLLFLNHPEGIMFSHLPDYRDELMDIYNKIKGPWANREASLKRVMDVTDPLNNSINVNCSRIRVAFVSQFDEHLAHYYYVDGRRGEPKKITLPRELVKWDK